MAQNSDTIDAPTLTIGGGTRMMKSLTRGREFVIGSARGAHFRLPHPSLAPQHAVLLWDGRQTQIRCTGADLEMRVNGADEWGDFLRDGDVLQVGDFEFIYGAAPLAVSEEMKISFRGTQVNEVALFHGLKFGHAPDAEIYLDDPELLPVHAIIEETSLGFYVCDQGGSGLLVNGGFFSRHLLHMGDRLDFGESISLVFDGWGFRRVPREIGCSLTAQHLDVVVGGRVLLRDAGFAAEAGDFVGIIGPSGAGKTTLLRTLLGLVQKSAGTVKLNRVEVSSISDAHEYFGYVPQKEIVHLELTGRQTLNYAAALRLPKRTPAREIERLIQNVAARLGLDAHLDTLASRLSGGQLKRLSVAVELLKRPHLLLLDEPTSGLDPDSETRLMRQLRDLTATGCTIICTTHLMENVHLMDCVEVVAPMPGSGSSGTTVFRGRPRAAKEHFDAEDFNGIYERLREQTPNKWREIFTQKTQQDVSEPPLPAGAYAPPFRAKHPLRASMPILLQRQWDILRADSKNLLLLLGQPLFIGILIAVAASGAKDQSATKLFLAYIAVFWMACGNAAPDLVREHAIFRRERFAGLGIGAYLGSKFIAFGSIALIQSLILFATLKLSGLGGVFSWQILALGATSLAATGIGLLISALSRSALHAVLWVPVITVPQILFSGFVFKVQDWNEKPLPRLVSRAFPGFAAQRLVDTSLLWNAQIRNYADLDEAGLLTSYENLSTALYPVGAWLRASIPRSFAVDETRIYSSAKGMPLGRKELTWDVKRPPSFRLGATYAWATPALIGLAVLAGWMALSLAVAALVLRRQRE